MQTNMHVLKQYNLAIQQYTTCATHQMLPLPVPNNQTAYRFIIIDTQTN